MSWRRLLRQVAAAGAVQAGQDSWPVGNAALADRHWAAMRSARAYELTPHARHAQAILILSDPCQLHMLAMDFGRALR